MGLKLSKFERFEDPESVSMQTKNDSEQEQTLFDQLFSDHLKSSPINLFNAAHHIYKDSITVSEFNATTMTKPIEVNGIVHNYLNANFSSYTWNILEDFDPITFDKEKYIADYDVGIQNFHYFMHSLLYSYVPPSTLSSSLGDSFINTLSSTSSKFSPNSSILTKLPYPIEQSALCTLPLIQQSLLEPPISSTQFLLQSSSASPSTALLDQIDDPKETPSTTFLTAMQFHILILSLYSRSIATPLDKIKKNTNSINKDDCPESNQTNSSLLQFPPLTLDKALEFANGIHLLFSSQLISFDFISPLTVTLIFDIFTIFHYYSLYFRWTTLLPQTMDQGFEHIIRSRHSDSYRAPQFIPSCILDPQNPSIISNYQQFFDQFYTFPSIHELFFQFVPETHKLKILNIYFHHTAFYTLIESEFISRTYKVTLPHAAWAIPEPPPFRTLTTAAFSTSDFELLSITQHRDQGFIDTTQTPSTNVLPKTLLNSIFPEAPGLKMAPEYATIVQKYLEPILFPPCMVKVKTILQKFSWRLKISNFSDISSILSFPMPTNHSQLAIGYIASMLYENRRFGDLSILLAEYNIVPSNAFYTIYHHTMFPDFICSNTKFDPLGSSLQTSKYLTFAKSYAHSTLLCDFDFLNLLFSSYSPEHNDVTLADHHLPYLIQLWFWIKYHNTSARGISPFLLQPVSIHYHHYYQYTLGSRMFIPLALLGCQVYNAVLNTVHLDSSFVPFNNAAPSDIGFNLKHNNILLNNNLTPQYTLFSQYVPSLRRFSNELSESAVLHAQNNRLIGSSNFLQVVGMLNLQFLKRMNPHVIETLLVTLIGVQLTLVFTQPNPTAQHLHEYYTASLISPNQPHQPHHTSEQSRLLLSCIGTIVSTLKKEAERALFPSVNITTSWFQHFSRIIKMLRNDFNSSYSIHAHAIQIFDQTDIIQNEDEFNDQRINVNNRHITSLFDNFIFCAHTFALTQLKSDTRSQELQLEYSCLPVPILPIYQSKKKFSTPIPFLIQQDLFLSTFQLLFSDIVTIFSTNILWYAGQLFTHFFSTQPLLQDYLQQNKNESEFFVLNPFFHFTPSPATVSTMTELESTTNPLVAHNATSSRNAISASLKINKFIPDLLPYTLDLLYLCNQFNPFVKLQILQQLRCYFLRILFFGVTIDLPMLELRLRLAQATGTLPAFKNYAAVSWFVLDVIDLHYGADLITSMLSYNYTNDASETVPNVANHTTLITTSTINTTTTTIIASTDTNDTTDMHRKQKTNPTIDPISLLIMPKYGHTMKYLSFTDSVEDFASLYKCWCLLYSLGYIHSLKFDINKFPIYYLPQFILSLHGSLNCYGNNTGDESASPISIQPLKWTMRETASTTTPDIVFYHYIYCLTTPTTPHQNPTLALYNLTMMQSFFLPPTLPYFSPSLLTSFMRIALHGLERLMSLWNYHCFNQNSEDMLGHATSETQSPDIPQDSSFAILGQLLPRKKQEQSQHPLLPLFNIITRPLNNSIPSTCNQSEAFQDITNPLPPYSRFADQEPITFGHFRSTFRKTMRQQLLQPLYDEIYDWYHDIQSQCSTLSNRIALLQPYEYAAIWLLFGSTVNIYELSSSDKSLWQIVQNSPLETISRADGSTFTIYSDSKSFVQIDPTNEISLDYNMLFLSNLLIHIHQNPITFCTQIRTLLFKFSNIASYWEHLETIDCTVIPFQTNLPTCISTIEQCHQALEILDFDLPAFSTPWEAQPHCQGLLYFLYDSIIPNCHMVDEILFVLSKFNDSERVFSPPTSNKRATIEYYDYPSQYDKNDIKQIDNASENDVILSTQPIFLSIIDGVFLRAIQRQVPIQHLRHLIILLSPHFLELTIHISHSFISQYVTEYSEESSSFGLCCTIHDYIYHCHPDADDIIAQMNAYNANI